MHRAGCSCYCCLWNVMQNSKIKAKTSTQPERRTTYVCVCVSSREENFTGGGGAHWIWRGQNSWLAQLFVKFDFGLALLHLLGENWWNELWKFVQHQRGKRNRRQVDKLWRGKNKQKEITVRKVTVKISYVYRRREIGKCGEKRER